MISKAHALALVATALVAVGCGAGGDPDLAPGAPFAIGVTAFEPGPGAGFGQDRMPDVVLGPPRGGGVLAGSTDVVALGVGGTITLELGVAAIDGPGPDLIVFENAFHVGGRATTFAEPAIVEVSDDGATFVAFACAHDQAPEYAGCAGVAAVHASPENGIDPTDPQAAGGDAFDLADVGVARARFVRIRDAGGGAEGGDTAGFDLDAVAVVHSVE